MIQRIFRTIILSVVIILSVASCKPKQIIIEKVITEVDSSGVLSLQKELSSKQEKIEKLQIDLKRTRDENTKLQSEMSTHTINYDTKAPLKPDGSYPIASETKTASKSITDKIVKEFEQIKTEYERVISALKTRNDNLEYDLKLLKSENIELKNKQHPQSGTNFRLIVISFAVGLSIPTVYFMRDKLKKLWKTLLTYF